MSATKEVVFELREMRRLGMTVPRTAAQYVRTHAAQIEGYRQNGMKVSAIADLVIQLVQTAQAGSEADDHAKTCRSYGEE